jgi:hypothetical protein
MQVSFCSSIAQSSPTDLAVAPISGIMHHERTQGRQPKESELVNRRVLSGGLGTTQRQVFCPADMTPQVIGEKLFAIVDYVLPTPTPAFAQLCRAHRLAPSFFHVPRQGLPCVGHQWEQPGQPRPATLRVMPCASCIPPAHVSALVPRQQTQRQHHISGASKEWENWHSPEGSQALRECS